MTIMCQHAGGWDEKITRYSPPSKELTIHQHDTAVITVIYGEQFDII